MSERVLVTGGAGFIGSELTRQLVERGHQVVVVDNLATGHAENIAGLDVEFHRIDIRDMDRVDPLMRRVDKVFHLACLGVRHSIKEPWENHDVNAAGTLRLLLSARHHNVPRFIHCSSSEVYGTAQYAPMPESHPTEPCTVYGASKLAGEAYARAFYKTWQYPTVVVRPFNTYGPRCHHEGDSGEVIPKFMLRSMAGRPMLIFGDGMQTRDFTYVEDSARGLIEAGAADGAIGKTLNLGFGREVTINDLAQAVHDAVHGAGQKAAVQHDEPRPGDVLRLIADMSAARTAFGYEPRIALREGLQRLAEWYRSQPRSAADMLEAEVVHNWR